MVPKRKRVASRLVDVKLVQEQCQTLFLFFLFFFLFVFVARDQVLVGLVGLAVKKTR